MRIPTCRAAAASPWRQLSRLSTASSLAGCPASVLLQPSHAPPTPDHCLANPCHRHRHRRYLLAEHRRPPGDERHAGLGLPVWYLGSLCAGTPVVALSLCCVLHGACVLLRPRHVLTDRSCCSAAGSTACSPTPVGAVRPVPSQTARGAVRLAWHWAFSWRVSAPCSAI